MNSRSMIGIRHDRFKFIRIQPFERLMGSMTRIKSKVLKGRKFMVQINKREVKFFFPSVKVHQEKSSTVDGVGEIV